MAKTDLIVDERMQALIDKGGPIDSLIKAETEKLKEIKENMVDLYLSYPEPRGKQAAGSFYNACFTTTDVFDEPVRPLALFEVLKKYDKQHLLWELVKVDMTALRQVLSPLDVKELQGESSRVKVSVAFKK